jgi:RNA polymerase sigma-70 factor (ECF subfamily)
MSEDARSAEPEERDGTELESTASLITRVQAGDEQALERLMARHLPALRRWATGRVPRYARHLADTDDVVQDAVLKTLRRIKRIEPRQRGAFFAYLRQALRWEIGNQLRAARYRTSGEAVDEPVANAASPLEEAVGQERLRAYEAALEGLSPRRKEAVIMRLELGMSYEEIAEVIEAPSWNAARMVVSRALVSISETMDGNED